MKFDDFPFTDELLDGLDAMGFEQATPIQEQAIPIILDGRDLIGCAQTGTGKTAAFLLPVLDDLVLEPADHITTLILVPTRELALQIDQALQGFSYYTPVSSLPIYGGTDGMAFEREKKALIQGANVIIATPGRLLAHMNMGYVNFKNLRHLILDEADRMLHMGFIFDIQKIVSYLPTERQTLMFSATMSSKIRDLARKLLRNPEEISLAVSKPAERVKQLVYFVEDSSKNALIRSIVQGKKETSTIIFAGTKQKVKDLERELHRSGLPVACIHSDLEQLQREEVLRGFRSKRVPILVATDILSRGIDIDDIGMVINYDVPRDGEDYVHRIGRTARAESEGEAITLVNTHDRKKMQRIEQLIQSEIPVASLPEGISAGVSKPDSRQADTRGRRGAHAGKKGYSGNRRNNQQR